MAEDQVQGHAVAEFRVTRLQLQVGGGPPAGLGDQRPQGRRILFGGGGSAANTFAEKVEM